LLRGESVRGGIEIGLEMGIGFWFRLGFGFGNGNGIWTVSLKRTPEMTRVTCQVGPAMKGGHYILFQLPEAEIVHRLISVNRTKLDLWVKLKWLSIAHSPIIEIFSKEVVNKL